MNRVLLPILFVLLLLSPASALGMLKVTVIPKDPTAGEEVRIIVTTAVTNEPVAGANVYIKSDVLGKTLIGETDSNGELRYVFEEPGIYTIIVEKTGYRSISDFTLSVAELKQKIQEGAEKLKEKAEERVEIGEELSGVVIIPSDYVKEVIKGEIISRMDNDKREIAEKLAKVKITNLKQYILLSKDERAILLTKKDIPEYYVKVKGLGLGFVDYRGYEWYVFYVTDFEILDERGIPATVDEVLSNVERYKFELLNLSTHYRAVSVTFMYEKAKIAIPITIGFVSDHEKTRDEFIADILKHAGKFNRSEKLSRETIDNILQFEDPKRIAVFRLKPSCWIDSDAYVKGVLLGVDDAKAYMSIMPDRLKGISLPENAKIVLLEIDKTIKGEEVSIEDIRNNPEKFDGKQVVIYSVGAGVNISTNQVIEKALKAASEALPALAPAAAAGEANPVDVLVQAEARWYPAVPSSRYQIIPTVGALSYDGEYKIKKAVESTIETDKGSKVYGYVVTSSKFGFDFPVIVIQDKKFVRTVSRGEIKEDLINAIEEIKERIKSKAEEDIKAGSGIAFGEKIKEIEEEAKTEEKITSTPTETASKTTKTPGFEAILGIAALVYALRKVRK